MLKLNYLDKLFWSVSGLILFFLFFCLLLGTGGFLLNQPISAYYLLASLIISLIISFFIVKETKVFVFSTFLFFLILIGSYSLSIYFYDLSWDGMGYHQETIVRIAKGWNPINEELDSSYEEWIPYYQKGVEIIQAIIYSFTNRIESGKSFNLMLFVSAFLILFNTVKLYIKSYLDSVIIALLGVFCPVVLTQIFTYYIDFVYYLLLLIILGAVINLFIFNTKKFLLYFIAGSVILCTVKFSTIPTFVILCIGLFLYIIWKRKFIKPIILSYFTIFILSILTNFNPLITNLQDGKHIFYPLMGKEKIDIMNPNSPPYFLGKDRFTKFTYSLFAECGNDYGSAENAQSMKYKAKIPFTIKDNETEKMVYPDLRLSGFGLFFSGIFLTSIIILISIPIFYIKTKKLQEHKNILIGFYTLITIILVSVILNPEMWWARYVPQLWLIPILSLIMVWNLDVKYFKVLKVLLVSALFFNVYTYTSTVLSYENSGSKKIRSHLDSWKEEGLKLKIEQYKFTNLYLRLKEYNIPYVQEKIEGNFFIMPHSFDRAKLQEISNIKELDTLASPEVFRQKDILVSDFIRDNKDKTIVISAKDDASKGLKNEDIKELKKLGLNLDKLEFRGSYIAVISEGKVIKELLDNEKRVEIKNDGELKNLGINKIISAGLNSGNTSIIRINGENLSLNKRGLNIVLINKEDEIYLLNADTFKTNQLDSVIYKPIFK